MRSCRRRAWRPIPRAARARSSPTSSTRPSRCSATRRARPRSSPASTTSIRPSRRPPTPRPRALSRTDALNAVNNFLTSANNLSSNLSGLRDEANQRVSADVSTINNILSQISQTNGNIARIGVSGGDTSGLTNSLASLQDQLSKLMQVNISADGTGGVTIRSQDGVYLAGDQGAATLSYGVVGGGGLLTATPPKGQPMQITPGGGEVAGLMHLAGVDLPQMMSQLSEYVSQSVSQINAAHNDASSVPAPNSLTGTPIGMSMATAIGGFSGKTTLAITNSAGVMQQRGRHRLRHRPHGRDRQHRRHLHGHLQRVELHDPAEHRARFGGQRQLHRRRAAHRHQHLDRRHRDHRQPEHADQQRWVQLRPVLRPQQPDPVDPVRQHLGQPDHSFAQHLRPGRAAEPGTDRLQGRGHPPDQPDHAHDRRRPTVGDLINSLNSTIGSYGSFALDTQGHVAFTPSGGYAGATASVISDNTVNSAGGPNMTQLLGIGWTTQAARTSSYSIRADIAANPSLLSLSQLDLSQNPGPTALSALAVGDGRGAVAIANSGSNNITFSAAGQLKGSVNSISGYASELAGQIGSMASNASNSNDSAQALVTQTTAQRSASEGVNLDNELVNLTTFQQSYNACARLIQASKDMYDTLLQIL
ncbi:MAG: flagellar basal body rod C-terminal domain-containing protein [Caulobacteraceae bacterium]